MNTVRFMTFKLYISITLTTLLTFLIYQPFKQHDAQIDSHHMFIDFMHAYDSVNQLSIPKRQDKRKWMEAMRDEMSSLESNRT